MLAFTMDGHTLVAFITVTVAVVFIVVVIARMVKRDRDVRVTKIGVYVERDRFDAEVRDADVHHIDPEKEETRIPWPKREETDDPQGDA